MRKSMRRSVALWLMCWLSATSSNQQIENNVSKLLANKKKTENASACKDAAVPLLPSSASVSTAVMCASTCSHHLRFYYHYHFCRVGAANLCDIFFRFTLSIPLGDPNILGNLHESSV